MKKIILLILIIFTFVLFTNNTSNEIRIRVIANSNNSIDQSQKIKVVKVLKEELKNKDLDILEVEKIVKEIVKNYQISVKFEKQKYNTRYIDDKIVSGGTYKTLVIRIGKAEGKNYWSVLYPEYFNVSFEDVNSGDVKFRSWFYDTFFIKD